MCVCSRSITRIRLTRVAAAGGRLPIAPPVGGGSMSQYTQHLGNYGHFILAAMCLTLPSSARPNGMQSAFILWRRLDRPGHEVTRVIEHVVGPTVEGTAAFAERG